MKTRNRSVRKYPDQNQRKADHNVQHIVGLFPFELLDRKPVHLTREGLVQVDQPKSNVKGANKIIVLAHHKCYSQQPERDMKNIVRRRSARQAFAFRDQKTKHTGDHQQRSKYQ